MKRYYFLGIAVLFMLGISLSASAQQKMTDFQRQMREKIMQQTMQQVQGGKIQPPAGAAGQVAPAKAVIDGKSLFNDPSLGTNGKSCGSCHKTEGEGPLDGRAVDSHYVAYIQYCYEHALAGKEVIERNSIQKLTAYLKSLQKSKFHAPDAHPLKGGEEAW